MQPGKSSRALAGLAICAVASLLGVATGACGSSGSGSPGSSGSPPDGPGSGDGLDGGIDAELATDAPGAGPDAADAGKDGLAPGPPFCPTLVPKPRFCDDFDDGDLTNDWTQSAVAPGSVFALDQSLATSAPASFHFVARPIVAAASNNVLLRTTMFGVVGHGKLSFAAFLPSITFTKGSIAIAQFYVNLDDVYTLYLRGPSDAAPGAQLEEVVGGVTTAHLLTKLPPVGAWTRVAIDLDLVNGKATVMFDAQKALDATIPKGAGSEATVRLGAIVDGPADEFEAHIDDVIVDF